MTQKLLIGNCNTLTTFDSPDAKAWGEIYNMIRINTSMVDRSGATTIPFGISIYPGFEVPTDLTGFTKTYEECCNDRVLELVAKAEKLNVPIYLLYSGGIDSTIVLISFMKALSPEKLRERIVVCMNHDSIVENQRFYYEHIRTKCNIASSDTMSSLFDGTKMIVGGEHNDQLHGSDLIGGILRKWPQFDFNQPYTREIIVSCFKRLGMQSDDHINLWYDVIQQSVKQAPCEIKSVFDFFWWLNFSYKWQSVFFRILLRVDKPLRKNINQTFIDNYYHHFFSGVDFQKWSMLNPDLKIKTTWNTYKHHVKDLIYAYNGDALYRDQKLKQGSLYRLFLQKETPMAMTDKFEYIYDLDPTDFYQVNNSFSGARNK